MLETVQTRNSNLALKWQGRFVCSSVDPVKEASSWVQKNRLRTSRQKQVIVLGVGGGYHLVALQKEYPALRIIAIDICEELIGFCTSEHALELSDVTFVHFKNIQSIVENKIILKFIRDRYAVLKFAPATTTDEKKYQSVESMLLGRTCEGAIFLSQFRPELTELLRAAGRLQKSSELISIKTLETSIGKDTSSKTTTILKMLKEMIA